MIREAKFNDYHKIYELGELLHSNFKNVYNLEELQKQKYFKILVYGDKEEVLGFLMYTILDDIIDIIDIIVEPKFRKQKVASNLMDYMITNSPIKGKIYLEVSVKNEEAIKLYEKFNFKKIYTRKKYYGDIDAYVMERVNEDE